MANPLHDNPKSKPKEKAEEKPKGGDDEKAAVEKKAADTAKAGGEEKAGETEKAAGDGEAAASPKDKFMEGLKNIQKRHESERRDTHGNHREGLRQMVSRHNKEISDHFDLHFGAGTDTAVEGAARANSPKPQGGEPPDED